MRYLSSQIQRWRSKYWIVRMHGKEKHYNLMSLYRELVDGTLSLDALCKREGNWVSIRDNPDLQDMLSEKSIVVAQRMREVSIPWVSFGCAVLMTVANWLQTEELVQATANGWSNIFLEGRWWSLVGSVFLHGSRAHFLGNLISMLFFGWIVERAVGSWRTTLLMVVSVVCSSFFSWYFDASIPFIGASAIIFALWSAQIMIGFCFDLPQKYRFLYGWWGLIVLFLVLGMQTFVDGISHSVHLGGLVTGFLCIVMYKKIQQVFLLLAVLMSISFCFHGTIDSWNRSVVSVDGLRFSLPNEFVSIDVHDVRFWFHRNEPRGSIVSAWEQGGVPEVLHWWYEKKFSGDRNQCMYGDFCSLYSEKEEVLLVFERYGYRTRWVGCVFPVSDSRWRTYCRLWLDRSVRQEPKGLRQARLRYEKTYPMAYAIQRYAQHAELYGEQQLADRLYGELGAIQEEEQHILHRIQLAPPPIEPSVHDNNSLE